MRAFVSGLDRLDVLVNLAGVGRGPAEDTEDGFEQTVEVNLYGTMRTCYAARRLLEVRGGAIVNTVSMMSFFGSGTALAYASSKGGVVQFTNSLGISLGPAGVPRQHHSAGMDRDADDRHHVRRRRYGRPRPGADTTRTTRDSG